MTDTRIAPDTLDYPTGWDRGWTDGWQVGAGGTETPFLREGEWWLRVWNRRTRQYALYRFRTDTLEEE